MYLFLKEKHSSATDFFVHFLLLNLEMLLIKKKHKKTPQGWKWDQLQNFFSSNPTTSLTYFSLRRFRSSPVLSGPGSINLNNQLLFHQYPLVLYGPSQHYLPNHDHPLVAKAINYKLLSN